MNILMVSTDAKILNPESAVSERMRKYGTLAEKLTILVLGKGERAVTDLSENVHVVFPGGVTRKDAFKNSFWEGMREARTLSASLVTVQDPFFVGFVGWRIARALHIPLQAQVHTDFLNSAYVFSSPRKLLEVFVSFFILSQAECIRVVSSRVSKSLSFFGKKKISILPIRVTPLPEKQNCPSDFGQGPRILMVSRLESEKRVHLAIEALKGVTDAHLYIIGDGSLKNSLERTVRNLSLNDRVHFLGWKEDVYQYYLYADVYLHLSQFEGYGISLIEAGIAGLPIITTNVGVVGEILTNEESALVVSGNKKSISGALSRVFSDPSLKERLSMNAKAQSTKEIKDEVKYLEMYKDTFRACTQ